MSDGHAGRSPHSGARPLTAGQPIAGAAGLLILVHGRGGSPEGMLGIAEAIGNEELAIVAPRAAGGTWYPQSFLAPIEANEPGVSSGLSILADVVSNATRAGVPPERQILLGFSQGACLTLEFAARHPRRYGGVVGLTGGLIGPPGTRHDYSGTLDGTPVFLGSSDPDPHVPWNRVVETAEVLELMGAAVDLRRYPGMAHTVNDEELEVVRTIVDTVVEGESRDILAPPASDSRQRKSPGETP